MASDSPGEAGDTEYRIRKGDSTNSGNETNTGDPLAPDREYRNKMVDTIQVTPNEQENDANYGLKKTLSVTVTSTITQQHLKDNGNPDNDEDWDDVANSTAATVTHSRSVTFEVHPVTGDVTWTSNGNPDKASNGLEVALATPQANTTGTGISVLINVTNTPPATSGLQANSMTATLKVTRKNQTWATAATSDP